MRRPVLEGLFERVLKSKKTDIMRLAEWRIHRKPGNKLAFITVNPLFIRDSSKTVVYEVINAHGGLCSVNYANTEL